MRLHAKSIHLRKATISDIPFIWEIMQQAIEQRRRDGSNQWQDGYPNKQAIYDDINNEVGWVITDNEKIIAYSAVIFDIEPAYTDIIGKWLSDGDYAVIHRMATVDAVKRKGVATHFFKLIEDLCIECKVYSIKVDTNFDNIPMLKILDKLNYTYCGEVYFRNSPRKAFEKILEKT